MTDHHFRVLTWTLVLVGSLATWGGIIYALVRMT